MFAELDRAFSAYRGALAAFEGAGTVDVVELAELADQLFRAAGHGIKWAYGVAYQHALAQKRHWHTVASPDAARIYPSIPHSSSAAAVEDLREKLAAYYASQELAIEVDLFADAETYDGDTVIVLPAGAGFVALSPCEGKDATGCVADVSTQIRRAAEAAERQAEIPGNYL